MKTKIIVLSATVLFVIAIFSACKKDNSSTSNSNSDEASIQSDDQARFSNATDAVANDADAALELSPSFSGRLDRSQITFCNAAAVFDSVSNPRTITITYSGADCLGATTRTGVVVLSMAQGVHWKNAGAAITITYQNLKITRVIDNKSITLNGSQTYTNVNGGLLINLPVVGTITHAIASSNMSVTFEDNTQRTWQVAEQRVFTYNNGVVITTTGTHTDGSNTNIAEWGTNRLGHTFASSTVQPIVIRQDCNFRIVSGEIKHVTPAITVTATFGLDASGNPTACPGTGHYYFEIVWTGPRGNSLTAILPY